MRFYLDSVTPGFVDFAINSPRVWQVQNAAASGDGRSLASASAAANAATDIIYVFSDIRRCDGRRADR